MLTKLLLMMSLFFAGAFPLAARAGDGKGIPLFQQVEGGVFKRVAVIEADQPDGISVLFCLTVDGKTMRCIAGAVDEEGVPYILISRESPVMMVAGQ